MQRKNKEKIYENFVRIFSTYLHMHKIIYFRETLTNIMLIQIYFIILNYIYNEGD